MSLNTVPNAAGVVIATFLSERSDVPSEVTFRRLPSRVSRQEVQENPVAEINTYETSELQRARRTMSFGSFCPALACDHRPWSINPEPVESASIHPDALWLQ